MFLLRIVLVLFIFSSAGCSDSANTANAPKDMVASAISPEQEFANQLKLAQSGQVQAQSKIANMYLKGEGISADEVKAIEWYDKAAQQGDVPAMLKMGEAYSYAFGKKVFLGIVADPNLATKWYQTAANRGSTEAQFMLGLAQNPLYKNEFLRPTLTYNAANALEYYRKAADHGHVKAMIGLSDLYGNGVGVPRDSAKSLQWLQRAAAEGYDYAQVTLGAFYDDTTTGGRERRIESGINPAPNLILAYAWFNLAAAGGDYLTDTYRSNIRRRMTAEQLAWAERLSSNWTKGQILGQANISPEGQQPANGPSKKGSGTLFFVNSGQAITNHHVVANCPDLRLQGSERKITVVTEDRTNDLALLSVQGSATAVAPIVAEPSKLRQGDDIVAFGFPLSMLLSAGGNLTPGVVSALSGLGNNSGQIQITAAIQPGSSGSPVLNKKGEVVGVVAMKLDDKKMAQTTGQIGQNVNFAVSAQTLKSFLDSNRVEYTAGLGYFAREKNNADLADDARKWTSVIECWKR